MSAVVTRCDQLEDDLELTAQVVIVGSGAGGSVLAARLATAGVDVVVLEAGGHHTREDFTRVDERWSYPNLYQERGARATADLGITILQGRGVGGGTLINWTTCYRTPARILEHWRATHGTTVTEAELTPHWEAVEERLGIERWPVPPNANNGALQRGCTALGWESHILRRNVRGCANSGLCGLGCPFDAKQAMHLTFLDDAQKAGARIYSDVQVQRIERDGNRATGVVGRAMRRGSEHETGRTVRVRAPVVVASGGAINSPALLLRSGIDPNGLVGKRTFLHPVVAMLAQHPQRVDPYRGAPQSVSSHEHIDRGPGRLGFFLESAPLQPMLAASSVWASGTQLHELMRSLSHLSVVIALSVDGIVPGDDGGTVSLRHDGRIRVDYPIREALHESLRAAHLACARVLLASGADRVLSTHIDPVELTSEADLPALEAASFGLQQHGMFSAHQMGGCPMGADPERHVVDLDLAVRGIDGLFVVDGSVLPTALGVNPSQTIYGLAHWIAPTIRASLG